jgi:hypothetical protein
MGARGKPVIAVVIAGLMCRALWPILIFATGNRNVATAKTYTDWSRDLVETTPQKYRFLNEPFYAGVTGCLGERLHILCRYVLAEQAEPVLLRGSRENNDDFWPATSFAVSNDRNANWTPIGEFNPTVDADVLSVDHQNPKAVLWVPGEPFRESIGNYRWGRITLIGDPQRSAVFALEDLLPPRGRRAAGADFKEVLDDRETARFGSAAVLHSVTSIHDKLTAEFIYVRDHSLGIIEGERPDAADFWPTATFQVGDSDEAWTTIGEDKRSGDLRSIESAQRIAGEPFRIDAQAYKKSIGHARYGKVIFSDSSFAIFMLESIDPAVTNDGWGR